MTTPKIEAVLERVQKMLNVQGRTPEEAALYVQKAHAILAEYDLTIDDIGTLKADPRTAVNKSEAVASSTKGKPDGWKADLLRYVAQSFECRVMAYMESERTKSGRYRTVTHYTLVGFKHDVEAAKWAHAFLVEEVTRPAKAYARTHWDAIEALASERGISHHDAESEYVWREGTHPLKAELYFIKGATQTVGYSLQKEWLARRDAAAAVNPHGLVVQKAAEIEEWIGRDRYGDRWEEVKKRRAEAEARAKERVEAGIGDLSAYTEAQAKEKPESPSQRRRREAAERRANERYWRKWEREQAKIDQEALVAGQRAGESIKWKEEVR
jgi:hypothetical protein